MPIQELSTTFDGEGNNYQYNGKELNEDFGLHWMDYGARWYDPQTSRWGQIDPLAEKFYHESHYAYVANNPMIFVDPDGEFIVPYWIQKQYPEFYKYINNTIGNFFLNNQTIKDVLYKYTVGGLTESAIKTATTPGDGPNIAFKKFDDKKQLGEYDWDSNTIFFNENLVSIFNSYISNESIDDKLKSAIAITLTSTIVNEFTHYGDALDGLDAILNKEGEIVNGPLEGGMIKEFDEGNEAAKALYPFYPLGPDKKDFVNSGLQNYHLLKDGHYFNPEKGKIVGSDEPKKNPTLIPPIKK